MANAPLLPIDLSEFQARGLLGRGGSGIVIAALHTASEELVALKLATIPQTEEGQRKLARLTRGARHLESLPPHPNIVQLYAAGPTTDGFALVMEHVDGITLREVLKTEGALRWEEALRILAEVAAGAAHAHAHGIIHRDLKPRNVVLDKADGWRPRLIDFDLAREPQDPALTLPSVFVGSPHFVAPETIRGGDGSICPATDVFALGVILYEMITGERPFQGDGAVEVVDSVLHTKPRPMSELVPGLPPQVEAIVSKALRKDPRHRFRSAADLRVAIQAARAPAQRRPSSQSSGKLRTTRRRRRKTARAHRPRRSANVTVMLTSALGLGVLSLLGLILA